MYGFMMLYFHRIHVIMSAFSVQRKITWTLVTICDNLWYTTVICWLAWINYSAIYNDVTGCVIVCYEINSWCTLLFWGKTKYICIFYFPSIKMRMRVKGFLLLLYSQELFIQHNQYHGCWCFGEPKCQGMNSLSTGLVFPDYSGRARLALRH